ncbi:MAG: low specificity L-threonine aldolase [Chryseolinea sp.]
MNSSNTTFASDNYAGVHPDIMQALINSNTGHEGSYGGDQYTSRAIGKFKEIFGDDVEVFFAYNGTGANVLGLACMTRSFNSILCSELAHINVDESTAPEVFTGCKLIPLPIVNGKITPLTLDEAVIRIDDQHHPQAKVISISQTTEYGTVYTKKEILALSEVARKHKLLLHMDGSRISNAAVSLNEDFKSFTKDAGVDVLSFGGTKNGMMFGEAVVFLTPAISEDFKYIRKQGMQLHSKMRFIGAQFEALLSNDLWKKNAQHANRMAGKLEQEIRKYPKAVITHPVDANSLFVTFPEAIIPKLQEEHFFYVWNDKTMEVRLMCAFDTAEKEIENFGRKLEELLG